MPVGSGQPESGAQGGRAASLPADPPGLTPLADAAALGQRALASMLAGTDAGITVVDADRRYAYANPAACRMLGRSLEELRDAYAVTLSASSHAATTLLPLGGRLAA